MDEKDYVQKHLEKRLSDPEFKKAWEETKKSKNYKFEDFATEEDKKIAREALEWDITDKDLFE